MVLVSFMCESPADFLTVVADFRSQYLVDMVSFAEAFLFSAREGEAKFWFTL